MTSKERMLAALNREKPDRLPVTVHQWQQYHLDTYMGGIDDLAAYRAVGLDAQIQYFETMGQFWLIDADFTKLESPEWRDEAVVVSADPDHRVVHHAITTPGGTLTYKTEGNRQTTWITEYLIKRDEDIELIGKYMPVPGSTRAGRAAHDEVGDHGILRGFVWGDQAGCWQHACCLMDINDLIMAGHRQARLGPRAARDPAREEAAVHRDHARRPVRPHRDGRRRGIIHRDLAEACTRSSACRTTAGMHDALHDLGFMVTYHTCGGTFGIEELIVANGCDASETLAPERSAATRSPGSRRKIGGRLALIGGMDQFNILTTGRRGNPADGPQAVRDGRARRRLHLLGLRPLLRDARGEPQGLRRSRAGVPVLRRGLTWPRGAIS